MAALEVAGRGATPRTGKLEVGRSLPPDQQQSQIERTETQIALAQRLFANGYRPVPISRHDGPKTGKRNGKTINLSPGKRPHGDLWSAKEREVYEATTDTIGGWSSIKGIADYPGLGIACGKVAANDIDVYEVELADAIEAVAVEDLGETRLRRVGQPPKRLGVYRAAGKPITKEQTPELWKDGLKAKVEVLGRGLQFVAYGIHPDTNAPFTWGEATPETVPLAELPAITQEQAAAFVAKAERMLRDAGYRTKDELEAEAEAAQPSPSAMARSGNGAAGPPHASSEADSPFWLVNQAALANPEAWVPELFPKAELKPNGAWRVSSRDLGRDLEEDLSIAPNGIVDFGVHDQGDPRQGKRTAIDLVIEHGGAADPVQAAKWLADKLGVPFKLGKGKPVADPTALADTLKAIKELNERHFTIWANGKALIGGIEYDNALKRKRLVFSKKEDIKLRYNNRRVVVGYYDSGKPIVKDLGTAWIEHPLRRSYDGVTLDPSGKAPPNIFNMWHGWGVEPKAGEWPLLRAHIHDVICSGNEEHFNYLLGWLAYGVQHPERMAEVATVLKGLKGTGKGALAQVLLRIFRHHALQITQQRHLTGNFNAHLFDVLFLFVDEAFWGGDKQAEGVLKGLITEAWLMIEPKGIDPFPVPNRLKIMIASNADWTVPASEDERRFLALEVSAAKRCERAYWNALYKAQDEGETAAFLDFLLKYDLSKFSIRDVPHTAELNRQKIISADSVTQFWHDCLIEGAIVAAGSHDWPPQMATQLLHAAYIDWARDHGVRRPATDDQMGRKLRQLSKECPDGCGLRSIRPREGGLTRGRVYTLASLEDHRKAFLKAMSIDTFEWPVEEEGDAGD